MFTHKEQYDKAIDEAINYFEEYFRSYNTRPLLEILTIVDTPTEKRHRNSVIDALVTTYTASSVPEYQLAREATIGVIRMVVGRMIIKPYLEGQHGRNPEVDRRVESLIEGMPDDIYYKTLAFIAGIINKGYIDALSVPVVTLLQPLDNIVDALTQIKEFQDFHPIELCAMVIHSFGSLTRQPKLNFGPIQQEYNKDVPMNGYNCVVDKDAIKNQAVFDALVRLNPAARYQAFKLVNKVLDLGTGVVYAITVNQQQPITVVLFPGEDVTLMRAALSNVQKAYEQVSTAPLSFLEWVEMIRSIYSFTDRFYSKEETLWLRKGYESKPEPMDTSFVGTIIDAANPLSEQAQRFMIGFNYGLIERTVPPLTPPSPHVGNTVISPKALLDKFKSMHANAVKRVIDEINDILDNPERVDSFATYDLSRGIVSLEIRLQSPIDGIHVEVFEALKTAGWKSTYIEGVLTIEATVPTK